MPPRHRHARPDDAARRRWEAISRRVEPRWAELDRLAGDGDPCRRAGALAEKLRVYEAAVDELSLPD